MNKNMSVERLKEMLREAVGYALSMPPHSPEDLMKLKWPKDVEAQGEYIRLLISYATSPLLGWRVQTRAFDRLQQLAQDFLVNVEFDNTPRDLRLWAFFVFAAPMTRPKRPKGRDPSKNAIRDMKISQLVSLILGSGLYTREKAICLIAEVSGMPEDTVVSALRRGDVLSKRTLEERLALGINLWGEKTSNWVKNFPICSL